MLAGGDDGDLDTALGTRENVLWRTIDGVEDTQHGLLFHRHERKRSGGPEQEMSERLAWERTQRSDGWSVEFWTLATLPFPNNATYPLTNQTRYASVTPLLFAFSSRVFLISAYAFC